MTHQTVQFVLMTKAGQHFAGPFASLADIPTAVDWTAVDLKITAWTIPGFGKIV